MNYYDQRDGRSRRWGIIGAVLYVAVCVAVMFITYTISTPEPEAGILVDFGDGPSGSGQVDTRLSDRVQQPAQPPVPPAPAQRVMTTDAEDAPAVAVEVPPQKRPEATPTPPTPPVPPAREVNRRALFPGRTEGSTATSQGTSGGTGNEGSPEGGPDGSGSTGGIGSSGFSLAGRYLVGNLPRPAYNIDAEGRVIVRITVNPGGVVTSADFEASGSTTSRSELVNAALAAARRARFTVSEAEVQTGTITYIFRLN